MTDAELQAALSASAPAPNTVGTQTPPADVFDVFVTETGETAPPVQTFSSVPALPAPAPAPAQASGQSVDAALVAQLMQQNQALMQQIQANAAAQQHFSAQQALQQQQAPAPGVPEFSLDNVLDASDREVFKDFLPLLHKVAAAQRNHMAEHVLTPLQAQVAQLAQAAQQAERRAAGATDASFTASLYARIPQLPTVVNTPEWRTYLKTPAPYSGGRTVEQRMVEAYQGGDVATIAQFYEGFVASRAAPSTPPAVPAAGAPARAVAPPVPAGGQGAGAPRFISTARLDAALAAAQSGKMSRDAYDKLMDDMLSAGLEGAQLVN